jgi:serine/threonine-protein kinase HipA
MIWPDKLKELQINLAGHPTATLLKQSTYQLIYEAQAQRCVGLGLPPAQRVFQDGDLFAALDMNLPEGYLFDRIVDRFPKFAMSKMHLLALMGSGGIGRVGYQLPGETPTEPPSGVSRQALLEGGRSEALFDELVNTYIGAGTALSGVQPKVMVPVASKALVPTPNVIVKAEGARYPGLCANEWMCLTAARCAGLPVPEFALSADAKLLVIDRFDITPTGHRQGFEDIAAVMQLRVRDRLSSRKYIGSYEDVAHALLLVCSDAPAALRQFFSYLALSVLLRNGDAHLKNFGVLYDELHDERSANNQLTDHPTVWLSPLYDQVTTTIYTYERPGGIESVDHTMALKLRRGQRSGDKSPARRYPTAQALEQFGRDICGVQNPSAVIAQISDGMAQALQLARGVSSISPALYQSMETVWDGARLGY